MFHHYVELHRFALTMNFQQYLVAGINTRGQEIGEVKLLINWITVVAVLIEIEVANGSDDVAFL